MIWKIVGSDGTTCENMSREEAYVDLAIIDAKHMNKNWSSKGDRDFHLKSHHFVKTIITQESILSKSDEFVIIRGVAGKIKMKMIDVCGFNAESVSVYIDNYFVNQQSIAEDVKNKIKESDNMTAMASIPIYTWVICTIFKEDVQIELPHTTTHLCSYACLLFVRNHLKKTLQIPFPKNCSMEEIISNKNVLQVILCLAKLSKSTLKHKKVVFSETDIKYERLPVALEETGFIVKDQRKNIYQFRHLVLQEYLAALHLYLNFPNLSKEFKKQNFLSCLPIIAGLYGINKMENKDPITCFISNLRQHIPTGRKIRLYIGINAKKCVRDWLCKNLRKQYMDGKLVIDGTCSSMLAGIYESRGEISKDLTNILEKAPVKITNVMLYHDIRNAMYLLTKLKSKEISEIDISNTSNKKLPENLSHVLKLFFNIKGSNHIKLFAGDIMGVRSYSGTPKRVTVTLVNDTNSFKAHEKFLLSAITLVDTVTLDYSLDNVYPLIIDVISAVNVGKKSTNIIYIGTLPDNPTLNQLRIYSDSILNKVSRDPPVYELDLHNKNLDDGHIECLQPYIPYMTSIDISWNERLTSKSMKLISDSVIEAIRIKGHCNLKSIDLTYCKLTDKHIECLQPCMPYLEDIDIRENGAITSKSMKCISDIIMETIRINVHCNLKRLNLRSFNLTDEHIEYLQPCIPYLEDIDISKNKQLTSKSMKYISDIVIEAISLNGHCNLKQISLGNCNLTDEHIECLQPCIPYLEDIDITGNSKITSKSMKYLSEMVVEAISTKGHCNLKEINLIYCNLTDKHIECLQPCITYLEDIDISGNEEITSKAMKCISDVVTEAVRIKEHLNLKKLNLRGFNLTTKHIEYLQPCMPYLEDIDISKNKQLTSKSMKYISDIVIEAISLNGHCNLKQISLGNCNLTDEHIECLQPCIPYLEDIDITGNSNITSKSMKYLSEMVVEVIGIKGHCNLKEINLTYCNLTDEHIECLEPCIPYVEGIDISGNEEITSKSMKCISDVVTEAVRIKEHFNLKKINLRKCNLTDEHIECLQPCIPYLEDIDISNNKLLTPKSMKYISDIVIETIAMNGHCNLRQIKIGNKDQTGDCLECLHPIFHTGIRILTGR